MGECYKFSGELGLAIGGYIPDNYNSVQVFGFIMTEYIGEGGAESIFVERNSCTVVDAGGFGSAMFYGQVTSQTIPQNINFRTVLVPVVRCIQWVG